MHNSLSCHISGLLYSYTAQVKDVISVKAYNWSLYRWDFNVTSAAWFLGDLIQFQRKEKKMSPSADKPVVWWMEMLKLTAAEF